jgi:hypothetical protein
MSEASDIGEARSSGLRTGERARSISNWSRGCATQSLRPTARARSCSPEPATPSAPASTCSGADGDETYIRQYIPAFKALMFSLFTVERPLIVAANGHALAVHDRALLRTGEASVPEF